MTCKPCLADVVKPSLPQDAASSKHLNEKYQSTTLVLYHYQGQDLWLSPAQYYIYAQVIVCRSI